MLMPINGRYFTGLNGVICSQVSTAFPVGLKKIDNCAIYELLYGAGWRAHFADKNYSENYIEEVLGYKERYWAHVPGTPINNQELTSADLMEAAAIKAISQSKIERDNIDVFIAVTVTSPNYTNSMGAFVAGRLGLSCPAIEIKTGCASVLYAIVMAGQFIRSGARNVLIAAGETPSKITNRSTNLLYAVGDGGAAVIISSSPQMEKGISTAFLGTAGEFSGSIGSPGLLPPNQQDLDTHAYDMVFSDESTKFIQEAWNTIPDLLYKHAHRRFSDMDLLVPHQVNKKILQTVIQASGIPENKTINLIDRYANCGSVGPLIALEEAFRIKSANQINTIMMVAVGGGVSYGGLILNL